MVPLSGGLANETWRIGDERVLRIYRRSPASMHREIQLLRRDWLNFHVPRILDQGADLLVLEFVPHTPLANSREHGNQVGRALAEIHQQCFDTCGLFGDDITVDTPWRNFPAEIISYIRSYLPLTRSADDVQLLRQAIELVQTNRELLTVSCESPVLLHGDFKASNLHWCDNGLLVLDWEFTYAGPASMDIGQLVRWGCPEPFRSAFEAAYAHMGRELGQQWEVTAQIFDAVNLVGLLTKALDDSQQKRDCRERLNLSTQNAR